jgi:hypothetical protein
LVQARPGGPDACASFFIAPLQRQRVLERVDRLDESSRTHGPTRVVLVDDPFLRGPEPSRGGGLEGAPVSVSMSVSVSVVRGHSEPSTRRLEKGMTGVDAQAPPMLNVQGARGSPGDSGDLAAGGRIEHPMSPGEPRLAGTRGWAGNEPCSAPGTDLPRGFLVAQDPYTMPTEIRPTVRRTTRPARPAPNVAESGRAPKNSTRPIPWPPSLHQSPSLPAQPCLAACAG